MKKLSFLCLLAILLVFGGCSDSDSGSEGGGDQEAPPLGDVFFQMDFEESGGWDEKGHEDWARWHFDYQEDEAFDLYDMYDNEQVYIFKYSFSSNISIDELSFWFVNNDHGWRSLSEWKKITTGAIQAGTKYTGQIVLFPTDETDEDGNKKYFWHDEEEDEDIQFDPSNTYLNFNAKNRNVSKAATLYFYELSLEIVDKEAPGLETWVVSGKTFDIDTLYTLAKQETTFQEKDNVLHIKPTYNSSDYGDFVMRYDLNEYKGKKIKIEMSMNVYLKTPSWIAWQINSKPTPFYPVVLGTVKGSGGIDSNGNPSSSTPLTANTWQLITGSYIYTVPDTAITDDIGKQLYLSGMQIAGAEVYFADATINITEQQ